MGSSIDVINFFAFVNKIKLEKQNIGTYNILFVSKKSARFSIKINM
jgi:hypothetical protein